MKSKLSFVSDMPRPCMRYVCRGSLMREFFGGLTVMGGTPGLRDVVKKNSRGRAQRSNPTGMAGGDRHRQGD